MSSYRRSALSVLGVLAFLLVLLPEIGVAQSSVEEVRSVSPIIRALTSAAITLLAGGAYFVFARDSAVATMEQAKDEPLESFLWGFGIGIAVIIVSILLAITVIGLIVAIPLLIVFAVVELAAQAVVFVMLFESFLASKPSTGKSLVGAALMAGILSAIPVLGPLISFIVGSVGVGALFVNMRR